MPCSFPRLAPWAAFFRRFAAGVVPRWINLQNKFSDSRGGGAFFAVSIWETFVSRGVPPLPLPSESLAGRGVCKDALQNLEPQGVRGQNLDNKELAGLVRAAE